MLTAKEEKGKLFAFLFFSLRKCVTTSNVQNTKWNNKQVLYKRVDGGGENARIIMINT